LEFYFIIIYNLLTIFVHSANFQWVKHSLRMRLCYLQRWN